MTNNISFPKPSAWTSKRRMLMRPRRLVNRLLQHWARYSIWVTPRLRARLHSWRGVRFADPQRVFIGDDVLFDELHPEMIHIGSNVKITDGSKILTHFYNPSYDEHCMTVGHVTIEDDVFIGMNVIIAAPVRIGRGAVIGAGAVITKDIATGAIVVGTQAHVVGQRGDKELPDEVKGAWSV